MLNEFHHAYERRPGRMVKILRKRTAFTVCAVTYINGGSAHAVKVRLTGSFLPASVFTITASALIKTFRPADLSSSAVSHWADTLQKV
jgi:hypothetical protein